MKHEFQLVTLSKELNFIRKENNFCHRFIDLQSYFGLSAIAIFGSGDGLVILYLMFVLVGSTVSLFGLIYMAYDKFSNGDRMVVGELVGHFFLYPSFRSIKC